MSQADVDTAANVKYPRNHNSEQYTRSEMSLKNVVFMLQSFIRCLLEHVRGHAHDLVFLDMVTPAV